MPRKIPRIVIDITFMFFFCHKEAREKMRKRIATKPVSRWSHTQAAESSIAIITFL